MSMVRSSFAAAVRWLLAGWLLFVAAPAALAGPYQFAVEKNAFFDQTSGSQPTAATSWSFNTQIFTNGIPAATLTPPGGSPISMNGGGFFLLPLNVNTYFTTQLQLDTAFPDGNYSFGLTGNSSGGIASLTMPDNSFYPATVPFLTPASFSAIQHYNPAQSLQLAWNLIVPDARTTYPFVDFFIDDESNFATLIQSGTSTNVSSFTSITIPAGTLLPDHAYQAVLVFSNDLLTPNAYFGDYDTDAEKQDFTDIDFTTTAVPEPSALALLGAGASALLAFGVRSRVARNTRQPG